MNLGDRADRFTVLIRDRAGQFTSAYDAVLADAETALQTTLRVPTMSSVLVRAV